MIFLKKSDIVDIIAPARFVEQGPHHCYIDFLKSWGLVPRLHTHTFGPDDFYANTLKNRVKTLQAAIESSDSKMVWCIQGGYGTTRVVSALPPTLIPPFPKILMGLSDCTALLFYAYKRWPWTVIHGPTLNKCVFKAVDDVTIKTVEKLLFGHTPTIDYGSVTPLNPKAKAATHLTGKAVGGNMCLMQTSLNTAWMPPVDDAILFLEDLNESPHRILERMHHLKSASALKSIKALVLFDFTVSDMEEDLLAKALDRIGQEIEVPVFKGQGVGHEARSLPIVLGQPFIIHNNRLSQRIIAH